MKKILCLIFPKLERAKHCNIANFFGIKHDSHVEKLNKKSNNSSF